MVSLAEKAALVAEKTPQKCLGHSGMRDEIVVDMIVKYLGKLLLGERTSSSEKTGQRWDAQTAAGQQLKYLLGSSVVVVRCSQPVLKNNDWFITAKRFD